MWMMELFETVFDFLINRPLVMMAAMAVPLFAAWFFKRCFPTRKFLAIMLFPFLLSIGTVVFPQAVWFVISLNLFLLGLAAFDVLTIIAARRFEASREVLKIASLGKMHECELTITNYSKRSCWTEIRDDVPTEFVPDIEKFNYQFAARSKSRFQYRFKSSQRGRFELHGVHIKVRSQLGLWHAFYEIPVYNEIFVYPDMKQISQYSILARTNRLNLMGVRRSRKIGQDNEFERLRDYTQDDNYKHIDWRTSARRRKLTVKDFQANQSQRLIFLVDCGRMMTGEAGGITLLDRALNSMLMLSYVALRQGDSVGLICFSDSVHNYTPPRAGVNHINRLLHAAFDQHSEFVESRYDQAFLHLRTNCLKRSLVVLITNVIDEINARQIYTYLSAIGKHHLPMGVLLRDHQMFDTIDDYIDNPEPENAARFYPAAVAANIINWRQQIITDLQHQGVLALDVFPENLTARLVNSYLEIKAKHQL